MPPTACLTPPPPAVLPGRRTMLLPGRTATPQDPPLPGAYTPAAPRRRTRVAFWPQPPTADGAMVSALGYLLSLAELRALAGFSTVPERPGGARHLP